MPEGVNQRVCELMEKMLTEEYAGIKDYRTILEHLGDYIYDKPIKAATEKILNDEKIHGIRLIYLLNEYCAGLEPFSEQERKAMREEFHP